MYVTPGIGYHGAVLPKRGIVTELTIRRASAADGLPQGASPDLRSAD